MANEKIVNRENLKAFRKAFQEALKNGSIKPLLTKGIDPISEDSGVSQETPFINQGTATANNDTTASVDTGDIGKQLEKQGNTIAKNNQVQNPNFESGQGGITSYSATISMANNVLSVSYTSSSGYFGIVNLNIVSGHKYLFKLRCTEKNSSSTRIAIYNAGTLVNYSWKSYSLGENMFIYTANFTSANGQFFLYGENGKTDKFKYFDYVDLTQWFNNDIPQDLLDNPSHWSWYCSDDYIPYNTGELVNCNGRYLECGQGRNIYNSNETYNIVVPNKPYFASKSTTITYYDKDKNTIGTESVSAGNTFTTPSNCVYINSSVSSITISIYYTSQQGGEGYLDSNNTPIEYPYVQPIVYDTGTEILRSAGSVKDTKLPSNEIIRRLKEINATSLTWTYDSGLGCWESGVIGGIKSIANAGVKANIISTYYTRTNRTNISSTPMGIAQNIANQLVVNNGSSTTKPTGYIYVELATPTTEEGTSFLENIKINDYSYQLWRDTDNNLVSIPQGCKLFYPYWYVGYIDTLMGYTEGSVDNIALKEDLTQYVKQEDIASEITSLVANVSFTLKKAYKLGSQVFLTITIKNETSSDISAGTNIINVPKPPINIYPIVLNHSSATYCTINASTGNLSVPQVIANGNSVYITISYAIA